MNNEPGKLLTCHRCGSVQLVLTEVCHEIGTWADGLVLTADGKIAARGDQWREAGEIQPALTRISCDGCGHEWHPRRRFSGAAGGEHG